MPALPPTDVLGSVSDLVEYGDAVERYDTATDWLAVLVQALREAPPVTVRPSDRCDVVAVPVGPFATAGAVRLVPPQLDRVRVTVWTAAPTTPGAVTWLHGNAQAAQSATGFPIPERTLAPLTLATRGELWARSDDTASRLVFVLIETAEL